MNTGKQIKKVNEGGIINRILPERFLILPKSCVSKYIQIIASNEVKGIEAIIPAKIVDLLDISEIVTIINAVSNIFKVIYILLLQHTCPATFVSLFQRRIFRFQEITKLRKEPPVPWVAHHRCTEMTTD